MREEPQGVSTIVYAVRIYGRGGQGVVTAAELLSMAAFADGQYAQAFPSFGSERMGAPVTAFCRIAGQAIRTREAVTQPDVVIIQDATLLHHVELFAGLSAEGMVLINSIRSVEDLGIDDLLRSMPPGHVCVVPASDISLHHMQRPIANTPLLGAFAALTEIVDLASVQSAIRVKFTGELGRANAAAAQEGYEYVKTRQGQGRSGPRYARTN
ncbi:MAG: 2-oxoacid:acceptor oxidoreductase family protein [Nitrospira sp.]|nr:2-oxoacid:acceptor oxidoreductase family protein [Nitrospira sp.]